MAFEFEVINGIKCYAPALAKTNGDFPAEAFNMLVKAEGNNFWFLSRNKVISFLVKKYLLTGESKNNTFLEIGCGTGFVLKGLSSFNSLKLQGAEIYLNGLEHAAQRLPEAEFIQLDAVHLPFKNEINAVGTFDVLEHITEDETVIKNVAVALKTQGLFFISVPQYKWMWSVTDDYAYHKRRYSRKDLKSKLNSGGFEVVYITSFVFTLFPFMMVSRFFAGKKKPDDSKDLHGPELNINPYLNNIFKFFMKIDEFMIRKGVSLPFGGSLIVVARKKRTTE